MSSSRVILSWCNHQLSDVNSGRIIYWCFLDFYTSFALMFPMFTELEGGSYQCFINILQLLFMKTLLKYCLLSCNLFIFTVTKLPERNNLREERLPFFLNVVTVSSLLYMPLALPAQSGYHGSGNIGFPSLHGSTERKGRERRREGIPGDS